MLRDSPRLELCVAEYRAQQSSGTVMIFATGLHRTSGFQASFAIEDSADGVPRVALWHVRQGGAVLFSVTPFSASISVQSVADVATVRVRDAAGPHEIAVEQVPLALISHGC